MGQQAEFDAWTIYEALNDRLDAAMCMGTGFVARRSALAEIGGWPLVEVGEDFMCSSFLSNAGWKIASISEGLQFGLCVDSMKAYVKQRTRWVLHSSLLLMPRINHRLLIARRLTAA